MSALIAKAIAQFVRTLISYESKYDKVLNKESKFTRTVKMQRFGNEALVIVEVSWTDGALFSTPKRFQLRERIFNWQNSL